MYHILIWDESTGRRGEAHRQSLSWDGTPEGAPPDTTAYAVTPEEADTLRRAAARAGAGHDLYLLAAARAIEALLPEHLWAASWLVHDAAGGSAREQALVPAPTRAAAAAIVRAHIAATRPRCSVSSVFLARALPGAARRDILLDGTAAPHGWAEDADGWLEYEEADCKQEPDVDDGPWPRPVNGRLQYRDGTPA